MDELTRLYRLAAEGKPSDFVALLTALRDSVYDVRTKFGAVDPSVESRTIAGAILTEAIDRLARIRKNAKGTGTSDVDEGTYG